MADRDARAPRHRAPGRDGLLRRWVLRPVAHLALAGLVGVALGPGVGALSQPTPPSAAEVRVPVPVAQLARAQQSRLTAAAVAHERAVQDEALALARAAVTAGGAAVTLASAPTTAPAVDPALTESLRVAQQELAELTTPPSPTQLTPPLSVTAPDEAVTPEQAQAPGQRVPATLPLPAPLPVPAAELEGAAQEVFALSLAVEAVATAATDDGLVREERVTSLEQAVTAAAAVARPAGLDESLPVLTYSAVDTDDPWPNGRIPLTALCAPETAPDALLRCEAATAFDALSAAFRAAHGTDLVVTSSYRSYDEQAEVRRVKGWLAAPPGASNHGRGIAVDLAGMGGLGEFDSPAYLWMQRHAPAFGWHHPRAMEPGGSGPPEPWHWEFVRTTSVAEVG